jgi:ParB family chromosome partitioning protein
MAKDRDVVRLQEELSQALGAVVIIDAAKNGAGTLKIRYANLDQLDDVVAKLR